MNPIEKLMAWIEDHCPCFCARCGSVMFVKNANNVQTTTGVYVSLCDDCYQDEYCPYSRGEE